MTFSRIAVIFWVVTLGIPGPRIAAAQSLDLAPHARVVASDTFKTFLMLWPRETDDGAFTVRDGAADTSWKVPIAGTVSLEFDFAPVIPVAPVIERIVPDWETPPKGPARVIARSFCGGQILVEGVWDDPTAEWVFDSPVPARCLALELTDAGYAALREVKLYAADRGEAPELEGANLSALEHGLRVTWTANADAALVRIDYLRDIDEPISEETLIETVPARDAWDGPRPLSENSRIALTPLSTAGVAGETLWLAPPAEDDATRHPTRGTIEGFYGTLWSDGERRRMMAMSARLGFGAYLYQPKWDLLNREQWRTPYSAEQIEAFGALRRYGERVGVTMIFGLGPAFDMIVDDSDERDLLLDKLAPLVDVGFRDFELGFDDIEFSVTDPVDGVMGAKHVDLVNWTQGQLSAMAGEPVNMWMMPTPYSTDRQYDYFPDGSDYIDQLVHLHDGIRILWNGPDTFAREISAADLEDVTERTGRRPVIWENMHCNDAGDAFTGKFYQAPVMNRSADMMDAVGGFMTNPLITGAASRLVYGSYEQYFADPAGYDPNRAMPGSVAMEVASQTDRELALRLSENYWGLGILGPPGNSVSVNRSMNAAMDVLRLALADNELSSVVKAGSRLLNVAAEMASAPNDLHHSGFHTDLVDDFWYPANRLHDEGRALLRLLEWLGERLAGYDDPAALEEAEYRIVDSLLHDRYHTSLLRLPAFKRRLVESDPGALGFEAPVIAALEDRTAFVGDTWEYNAGTTGDIAVHGLPGAAHAGGLVNWLPAHAGVYHVIVTIQGAKGWAWREFELVVRELPPHGDDDTGEDDDSGDDATDDDEADIETAEKDEPDGETGGCGY